MEQRSIYAQIADRTDGTVYIGVVGPVRTGKSTFIKRFMEQLVLPNIENVYERERATDELPQSGSGRTIMTAEPKFVPNEAARISPDGKTTLQVRLIDSVGNMIPDALGRRRASHGAGGGAGNKKGHGGSQFHRRGRHDGRDHYGHSA